MPYLAAVIVSASVAIVVPDAFAGNYSVQKNGKGDKPAKAQKKGHIGVIIQDAASAGLKDAKGVVILGAFPGLPAYESGLRAGDLILKVDGQATPDNVKEIVANITSRGPGKTVEIEYRRGDKVAKATVTLGPPATQEKIVASLKKAAEKGESWAQDQLANVYRSGKGIEMDYGKAIELYRKAAKQNYPFAFVHLGEMYILGRGVEKDAKKGVEWLRKGADKSLPSAHYLLGFCNEKGVGTEMDVKKAFKWFREAAKQGSASAQFNVGFMLERGMGVKMDVKQAIRWYRRSAEQGFEKAKEKLKKLSP